MATVDVSRGTPLTLPDFVLHGRSRSEPMSRPVLGLPLRRTIPMEVHSMLDYSAAGAFAASAAMASTPEAKAVGLALSGTVAGVSLLTDYDLSLAKLIPIEVHEAADYLYGVSAVLAPFVLGYWKKDPAAAATQIFTGLTGIIGSLFTDYRAATNKTWRGWPTR